MNLKKLLMAKQVYRDRAAVSPPRWGVARRPQKGASPLEKKASKDGGGVPLFCAAIPAGADGRGHGWQGDCSTLPLVEQP